MCLEHTGMYGKTLIIKYLMVYNSFSWVEMSLKIIKALGFKEVKR
jgi:hypothetical protein